MALSRYEDRYVIPTSHEELRHEDFHALQGHMGFTFGNDSCSVAGHDGFSLFPEKRKKTIEVKVMQFVPRAKAQTSTPTPSLTLPLAQGEGGSDKKQTGTD
jgi:nitrate reductase beta subunit